MSEYTCHDILKSKLLTYLLTYMGAKRLGSQLTTGQKSINQPVNNTVGELNANNFKMVKASDFKSDTRFRVSPDMIP